MQTELSESSDGDIAVWVDAQGLVTKSFGLGHVLLPLEDGKCLVDQGEHVSGFPVRRQYTIKVNLWRQLDLPVFVEFKRLVESLDRLLVLLLIKQELTAASSAPESRVKGKCAH